MLAADRPTANPTDGMDRQRVERVRNLTRSEMRILRVIAGRPGGTLRLDDLPRGRAVDRVTFRMRGMGLIEPIYEGARVAAWSLTPMGAHRAAGAGEGRLHYRDRPGQRQLEDAAVQAALDRVGDACSSK